MAAGPIPVRLLTPAQRDTWLERTPTSVLREAGDVYLAELTSLDHVKRVPTRLWQAAQHGYESERAGIRRTCDTVGSVGAQV